MSEKVEWSSLERLYVKPIAKRIAELYGPVYVDENAVRHHLLAWMHGPDGLPLRDALLDGDLSFVHIWLASVATEYAEKERLEIQGYVGSRTVYSNAKAKVITENGY